MDHLGTKKTRGASSEMRRIVSEGLREKLPGGVPEPEKVAAKNNVSEATVPEPEIVAPEKNLSVKVTAEYGVSLKIEIVYEAGGATLQMKFRAQIDGDETTASETPSTTTFDARKLYTSFDGSLKRRSSNTALQDVIATEERVKWQKDIAEYDPFTKVANSVLPGGDASGGEATGDEASQYHASDPDSADSPQPEILASDPAIDTARVKTQDEASPHHASDSESVDSPQPEIHATDPAFDNAKAKAQQMIGTFATAYSSDTDRDGCPLEGDDNVDWRLEELLSLVLPYLNEQARIHLLSTNSLIFNACQSCICYVSEVRSQVSNQYGTRFGHFKVNKVPSLSSYNTKFQILAEKKSGNEKITIVIYRGKQNSRPCFRDSAQHAVKTQQSFKAIEDLEQSMQEMAQDEAHSRATEIAIKYFDLRQESQKKVKNFDVVHERNKLQAVEDRLQQFVDNATARNFNVGIQVLEFQAAKHLRLEHILRGDFPNTFRCLRQLGILGCEKFFREKHPHDAYDYRAALGPSVELYWDFAKDEAVNSPEELAIDARFQTFLRQAKPQRFADFFKFDPQRDRKYHDKIPQLPLMREFLKVCPYALRGQACRIRGCVMAVPKDFQPDKAVGAWSTMEDREHLFIQPACRFALLDASGDDRCVKMPGMTDYDANHCRDFCHDKRLRAQYTFCCNNKRRWDHFFGTVNDRYWPRSTKLEEWEAYSEVQDSTVRQRRMNRYYWWCAASERWIESH